MAGCVRRRSAVCADPVKDTVSWQFKCWNRSPRLPHTSCSAPSGRIFESMMRRTTSSVRYAVAVAGLTMAGMPASKRRRQFFEHAPHRKIEGIDVDRRALARHIEVLADKRAALGQAFDIAIHIDMGIRQLARTLAGEGEHRADAAVDIDQRVVLGRAGAIGEGVELFFELGQLLGERPEHRGALMEGQCAQRRAAYAARVFEDRGEIDAGSRKPAR